MRLATLLVACLATAALSTRADAKIDFAADIQPIFDAHCTKCHGAKKGAARIRLHDGPALAESKKAHDDLFVAEKPSDSELYERLILPADSKKLMPKGGDPLPEKDIEKIKQWIAEGATFTVAAAAAGTVENEMPAKQAEPEPLPKRPQLEPASPEAIAAVEALGALVMPLYSGSAELRVSFPSSRDSATDETVAALVPLAGQLVDLDLSGTKITDASAKSLAKLVNLDTLHLERTSIGDKTIAAIAPMTYLRYLNLHTTKVTDAALKSLELSSSLRKLYLWKTDVSYEAAKALEAAKPGLDANLGWDHPGVVRERLITEMKRLEESKPKRDEAIKAAEKELEAAKAEKKSADERETALQKELEALDNPQPAEEEAAGGDAVAKPAKEKPADDNPSNN